MFEKLLSLLPYNPSLAAQVSFYAQRMRAEATVRRTGLVFLVLAFLVQFFAVISPPQATVADSSNDMIDGGFTTISQAVSACRQNTKYYGTILANYGISCSDVAAGTVMNIKSTDYNHQLWSAGWNPVGQVNPDSHKKTGETPVNLVGIKRPIYWQYLWSWDTIPYSTYKVVRVVSSVTHHVYFLMERCGNIASVGLPPPIKPCPYNSSLLSTSNQCVNPCPYNGKIPKSSPECFKPCPYNRAIPSSSEQCFRPCPYDKTVPADSQQCKPCQSSTGSSDTLACVAVSKTASDPTQGWSDADGRTAQPGDTIVYTLHAKNDGKATVKAFLMQENLSDAMDYADPVSLDGGSLDSTTGEVTWPTADIKAGATLSHTITVKVKNPVPQTPASTSNPDHFDLIMTNVYGNSINIHVPGSPTKTIETTSTTLVNTGPGTSLFVAAAVVVLAGYFYGRSRLLAKESTLALQSNSTAV